MTKLEENPMLVEALQYACKEGTKNGLLSAIETIKELKKQNIIDINVVLKTLEQVYKTYSNETRGDETKWKN